MMCYDRRKKGTGGELMLSFFITLMIISTIILLVAGLIISKKYAFMGGFYFFLILIIKKLYSLISGPITSKYIDSLISNNGTPPMGMTIGEYVTWISFIPKVLEVIAFSFLVVGLYKLYKMKFPFRN